MEQLTETVKSINDFILLEDILKLLHKYYDRETFNKLYNESEQEIKGTENEHNLKVLHEILDNKKYNYYLSLGLNNLELNNNESEFYDLSALISELSENSNKYDYLNELYDFNYFGYYMPYFYNENDFKLNISSEYHIIIDYENEKIFNLTENNFQEIITEMINETEILNNESILFDIEKLNYNNVSEIYYNSKYEIKEIGLKIDNCTYYNEKDKYILFNCIYENWKTISELDTDKNEILNEILNENNEIIDIILSVL